MLEIRPIHLKAACEFVKEYHRHNIPPVGGKFAISCYEGERLCSVAICGRPVARRLDNGETLEIYRNCTDGTRNACTKLYGACIRIASNMGYRKVITYTLESENGASLRAANFTFAGSAGTWWWTATPDSSKNNFIRNVYSDGTLNRNNASFGNIGVRPICVLKSEILKSYIMTWDITE